MNDWLGVAESLFRLGEGRDGENVMNIINEDTMVLVSVFGTAKP